LIVYIIIHKVHIALNSSISNVEQSVVLITSEISSHSVVVYQSHMEFYELLF